MGSLTKSIAPSLAGGTNSGGQDFLHMLMGSRAAGQAGYSPLAGLVGGMASLAGGGQPHTTDTLQAFFQKMGMSPIGSDPPGTPYGGATPAGVGQLSPTNPNTNQWMQPSAPLINPQLPGGMSFAPQGNQPVNIAPPSAPLTNPQVNPWTPNKLAGGGAF